MVRQLQLVSYQGCIPDMKRSRHYIYTLHHCYISVLVYSILTSLTSAAGLSGGAIAGIVIGVFVAVVIVAVIIILVLVFCFTKWRKKIPLPDSIITDEATEETPMIAVSDH